MATSAAGRTRHVGGRQASHSGDSTPFSFLKRQLQWAPAARGSCPVATVSVWLSRHAEFPVSAVSTVVTR